MKRNSSADDPTIGPKDRSPAGAGDGPGTPPKGYSISFNVDLVPLPGDRAYARRKLDQGECRGSGDSVIRAGLDGRVVSWNRGAERLFGVPSEAALERTVFDLLSPHEPERLSSALEEIARADVSKSLRLRGMRA
jgi:PAS domain-containing protein